MKNRDEHSASGLAESPLVLGGAAAGSRACADDEAVGEHPAFADEKSPAEEAFEEAFLRLCKTKPLKKITVSEVAEVAGYNRGTFYLHYESMEALIAAMEDDLMEQIRTCVDDCMVRLNAGEDPEIVMGAVLDLFAQNETAMRTLLGTKGDDAFVERLKTELKPLWAKYVLHREAPADGETDFTLEFTLSGAFMVLRRWLDNPKGVSPEQMLHLMYHKALGR